MSEALTQPVVLDATVLSNFASSSTIGHLVTILDHPVAVPAVRKELERGCEQKYEFLTNALDHLGDDIDLLDVSHREDNIASEIHRRLDEGEAESLLGAIEYGGILATDDLAARRLAADYDVRVTGSVGILVLGVRAGVITIDTANECLAVWKEVRGYYAPVDRVQEILG